MSKEIPELPKTAEPKISIWRFLLWGVILTVLFSYFFSSINTSGQVELAYSAFKEQLRSKNIAEVFFKGTRIQGKFREGYRVKGLQSNLADSITYQNFITTMPQLEDPTLMGMLEANRVTIKAWW